MTDSRDIMMQITVKIDRHNRINGTSTVYCITVPTVNER